MSLGVEPTLLPFFQPLGVMVVGASQDPFKLGFGMARNIVQSGYQGGIHFVNRKGGRILGRVAYKKIADVPDPVDLAILLIPASGVPAALEACGLRGIRAVIIASGGFRESGPEGAVLENHCLRIARDHDMRLMGPNCIGLIDTHLPLDTTFLPPPGPTSGDVAFISHSGAICAAVVDWARGQGFGLSRLVSLGNQLDIRETDVLTAVAADVHTRVITLYLEGISDGRRFVHEASRVARQKPVLALKVGRFQSGRQAVASHTGALAGQEAAFNAAFRRAGVIRVETSEELFDWARALAWCPQSHGRNVAVLTNAGGPGVTAADALEAAGMQLSGLSDETQRRLRERLPPMASVGNPVDMLAGASPQLYSHCLRILLDDPAVDSVLVILPPPPMYAAGGVARAMIPIIYSATKPVIVAVMGETMVREAVEYFRAARIPEYRFPEKAARALSILAQRAEFLENELASPQDFPDVNPATVHQILARSAADRKEEKASPNFLTAEQANQILAAYGIAAPRIALATTSTEALQIAESLGYPLAMKIASPDIIHKSDVGGIVLNISDAEAVAQGLDRLRRNALGAQPDAHIRGVHLQRMLPQGQEVIIGGIQDPQFGPLVMFGTGGIEVETLLDVEFALAPLTTHEAQALLDMTWAGRKLRGYRHIPAADQAAVIDTLCRLGQLIADFPQLQEFEINPLRVLPAGQGAFAIDARARLSSPGHS